MVEQCRTLFAFEDIDRKQNNKKRRVSQRGVFFVNKIIHSINTYRSAFHNEDDNL